MVQILLPGPIRAVGFKSHRDHQFNSMNDSFPPSDDSLGISIFTSSAEQVKFLELFLGLTGGDLPDTLKRAMENANLFPDQSPQGVANIATLIQSIQRKAK